MTDCREFPKRVRKAPWIKRYEPKAGDGLCPGFWSGCPAAFGCAYACSYCFLGRAKRLAGERCILYPVGHEHMKTGERGDVIDENTSRLIKQLTQAEYRRGARFINWGETADSLACNAETNFLQLLRGMSPLPGWHDQPPTEHLLLTKSSGDGWLDWILDQEPTDKLIFAFSVTTDAAWQRYENGTPRVSQRLQAAYELLMSGWRVRFRLDPMVPAGASADWPLTGDISFLAEALADNMLPELITLGTLRFNTSHPLVNEFGMTRSKEDPRWRLPFEQRVELYRAAVDAIDGRVPVALCKESAECWQEVMGDVPQACDIRCNCTA